MRYYCTPNQVSDEGKGSPTRLMSDASGEHDLKAAPGKVTPDESRCVTRESIELGYINDPFTFAFIPLSSFS